ncbi:MAG: hypothetical protein OXE58_07310 [Acidobacteria bacterium]|nr:hypothetical protein [Acidobacteriota bacterium]
MASVKAMVGLTGMLPLKNRKKLATELDAVLATSRQKMAEIDGLLHVLQDAKTRMQQHLDEASKIRERLLDPSAR